MATMDAERIFVDTNVLVYANLAEAPLHEPALAALRQRRENGVEHK
jgi:predicted nucleic acid-binding protein